MAALIRPESSAAPRWMTVALFASLALNLVVLGALGGFVWRHGTRLPPPDAVRLLPPSLLAYTHTLPAERRKELVAATQSERNNVRALRRELRDAREEVVRIVAAEPFDKPRLEQAQTALLATDQRAREAVYRLYTEIAANMTAEERRGYATWRQQRRRLPNPLDEPEKQASGVRH